MKNTIKGGVVALGIVGAMAAVTLGVPWMAHASPGDLSSAAAIAQFTQDMTNAGFHNGGGAGDQMMIGVDICNNIDAGSTPAREANDLWLNSHLTEAGAWQFVNITVRDLCPRHAGEPSTPPSAGGGYGTLNVSIPMSHPPCDGSGIVVLGSAVTPGRYDSDVQRMLSTFPGSAYLRTDQSCPSLRQATEAGDPIYAVYRVAGPTQAQVCTAVRAAGSGAYGKWLDTTTDPTSIVPC
jgi:hypothetical protein